MAYDLIKISALPAATPDESQEIVVGVGDYAKRINYGDVKNDMVGTSPTYTTDTEPYLMRRTAHVGVVGKCALNKLVGGSLGWNQLAQGNTTNTTINGVSFVRSTAETAMTINGTATAIATWFNSTTASIIQGHVYLLIGALNSNIFANMTGVSLWNNTNLTDTGNGGLMRATGTGSSTLAVTVTSGYTASNAKISPQLFDITAMLGSTIADYVLGLGVSNGIAWLSKYIDLSTYHAYDAGSIQSVQATAHVTKDADDNVIGNYPLGSDTLRGVPQLVSNKLSYDGDEKYPDGTIRRKYGIVDLGSLTWAYESGVQRFTSGDIASLIKLPTNSRWAEGLICGRLLADPAPISGVAVDNTIARYTNGYLFAKASAYSTAAAFKTAMSGVYLVYPLATETTEASTAFQKVQTIDADGTESFTTSSPVPVGHETQTPDNVLAALEWLGE